MVKIIPLLLALQFPFPAPPSPLPETRPDIQGVIREVSRIDGPGNVIGEISVVQEGEVPFEASGRQNSDVVIAVSGDTRIFFEPVRSIDFAVLRPGQSVQVWLQPSLLPTYPVQAWAEVIVVRRSVSANIPPPDAVQGPVRVGAKVQERKLREQVPPVYPEELKDEGVEEVVLLQVTADEAGNVVGVRAIRGHHLLVKAAEEAVRQWKYQPTYLDDLPVPVIFTVEITMKPR